MIIDLPTRRVYKADATSEYSIWYSYHSWLFCRLSQQDIHGLRGNGSSGKERTNKIQSEHSRLPCDRPNLIYFQKIIVFFSSSISAVRNPESSNLIGWFHELQWSTFSHPERKKRFSLSIATNKLSQLQNIRLNLLKVTFLAIENSTEVNLGRL